MVASRSDRAVGRAETLMLMELARRWRDARPLVRAEALATSWEVFSVLLFISAVVPAAFMTPWPSLIFVGGLGISTLLAGRLTAAGRRGITIASSLRTVCWLLAVVPLLGVVADLRVLVATCGFGLMAGGIRRALYRRASNEPEPTSPVELRSELRTRLGENAMVAGIVGGHVMLLFSVAFLRTESKMVFRAWWEIIPALAILGTLGFTLAVRPTTDRVIAALRLGPSTNDRDALLAGLAQAMAIPRTLTLINFAVWLICTSIGVVYFQPGPQKWQWADAVMQIAFGALFAWGVSFYQRGWHEDTVAPIIARLRDWTGAAPAGERDEVTLRQRMLSEFGLPLLFTLTLSLFASIGLYRTLGDQLTLREDFNAITALSASFVMLVLAVGTVFMRAARQLSDPLSRLARAADRVASGRLEAAVPPVTGPIEVVGLGLSIEHMRRALARTIAELKEERASLETNVEVRTAELRRALEQLKQAQTALIQGERMALIGELVASVAHEIHNPLNAIGGSISSLERVASELTEILAAYRESEALLPDDRRRRLETLRDGLDIDGALADLAGIVKVVQSATRRSVGIVGNLKSFARAPAEPIPADLHAGLSETLSLLRHKLRQREVEVVEDYGELPSVVCRAGEINQVFMNLLTNAIQAVAAQSGVIVVQTRRETDFAVVRISDNGAGVPGELGDKVFDPFFTTKQRGEGTGLGLSISREIVRRHGGTLTLEPGADGGASFVCRLPLAGPRASETRAQHLTA